MSENEDLIDESLFECEECGETLDECDCEEEYEFEEDDWEE
jgi:transcription initiation factor IIE alpha subunit